MRNSGRKSFTTNVLARIAPGILCTCISTLQPGDVRAQSEVDEIIVTGVRPESIALIPRSVSVITADDIARAPSTSLIELLAREANVNVRSTTGTDKFGVVDIRGMGDTATSNVLVLVDGQVLNASDLSGPDLSSVSLAQIQRIEIVRGANSVRYGNGAVGGVINILTKNGSAESKVAAAASYGSFDTVDGSISGSLGTSRFGANAALSFLDGNGYRDNGELNRTDALVSLRGSLGDWLNARLTTQLHEDDYGLPGPVSAEGYAGSAGNRRASQSPNDGGSTRDNRWQLATTVDLSETSQIDVAGQVRDRSNSYILGFTPLLPESEQTGRIEENSARGDLTYRYSSTVSSHPLKIDAGVVSTDTDYVRFENGRGLIDRSTSRPGHVDELGLFVAGQLEVAPNWTVSAGYRWDQFSVDSQQDAYREVCTLVDIGGGVFLPVDCQNETVTTNVRRDRWNASAVDLGVVYQPTVQTSAYASFATSFRNPNVDELIQSSNDLRPQSADHYELGVRQEWNAIVENSLSLFYMKTHDEILFGIDTGSGESTNRNADEPTERVGVEFEARVKPTDQLTGWFDLGYVEARFTESNTKIPLVAPWTATLGTSWAPADGVTWDVIGRYVAGRYDGNDFNNMTYPQVDSYTVVDTKFTWVWGKLRLLGGINNVFDEVYSTSVYSNTFYPMPSRNYYAGAAVTL